MTKAKNNLIILANAMTGKSSFANAIKENQYLVELLNSTLVKAVWQRYYEDGFKSSIGE